MTSKEREAELNSQLSEEIAEAHSIEGFFQIIRVRHGVFPGYAAVEYATSPEEMIREHKAKNVRVVGLVGGVSVLQKHFLDQIVANWNEQASGGSASHTPRT